MYWRLNDGSMARVREENRLNMAGLELLTMKLYEVRVQAAVRRYSSGEPYSYRYLGEKFRSARVPQIGDHALSHDKSALGNFKCYDELTI